MLKLLREKSRDSSDERPWRDIINDYPEVRELLYTSLPLFRRAAEGASEGMPWHISLLRLYSRSWKKTESEVIIQLTLDFLNEAYPPKQIEGLSDASGAEHEHA